MCKASEPPRKTTALPERIHKAATSIVTLGRDSKMTPTTPSGTVFLDSIKPFESVLCDKTCPVGSGRWVTESTLSVKS